MGKLIYSGEWDISHSYRTKKSKRKERYIQKKYYDELFTPSIFNCLKSFGSENKIYHFLKPFEAGEYLYIRTNQNHTTFPNGIITLRLQETPCTDSDISLYMLHSSENFNAATKVNDSQQLNNNLIQNYPKLPTWSRYNNQWNGGNVSSAGYIRYYNYGPTNLFIYYSSSSTLEVNSGNNMDQKIHLQNDAAIKYLIINDPLSLIFDIFVTPKVLSSHSLF
uniref:Uncharacterized protein n=1 Tax=Panagrolaimus davidi TaxID=227884 RepID=A0A914P4U7_9BILA